MKRIYLLLTGQVRHRLQFFFPELGDLYGLILLTDASSLHPFFVRMAHELRKIFRVDSIQYVEKIISIWAFVLRIFGWEVRKKVGVLSHFGPEPTNGELIIVRHLHSLDVTLLHELLFASKNISEEVL